MTDRELDVLVAEKVMGWEPKESVTGHYDQWTDKEGKLRTTWSDALPIAFCWRPSTSIADVWEVVESVSNELVWLALEGPAPYDASKEGWRCSIISYDPDVPTHCVDAATAPRAICLAALRAVSIEVSTSELEV